MLHQCTQEPSAQMGLLPANVARALRNRDEVPADGERAQSRPWPAGRGPSLRDTVHAVVSRSGDVYVVDCLELPVVTQGHTLDEAMANLREAVELHLEGEDPEETGMVARPRLSVTYETAIAR